jgi:hypothetical protein
MGSWGQNNYPVRAIVQVNTPCPSVLQDFANPIKNPMRVSLQLQDLQLPSRTVYLKVGVQGPGISVLSNDAAMAFPLTLTAGSLAVIPTAVIAQYFSANFLTVAPALYTKPLPAGLYTFTVEVYDQQTRTKLSDKVASMPVWIELNQPPVLIMPQNTGEIPVSQVQNVLFQWNPRHTQLNDVEYEFILTELPVANRGNIQNIFLSQPPIYKTIITTNSFLYNSKFPPLREGYSYAWRVQAKVKFGSEAKVGTFSNGGISEIYSFRYANPMLAPSNLSASWGSDFKYLTFSWKGEANHSQYVLSVTDARGRSVKEVVVSPSFGTQTNSAQVSGLVPTEKYNYQVKASDAVGRTASSNTLNIAAVPQNIVTARLASTVELKGGLTWSFRQSEALLATQNTLIATKVDLRKQERVDWIASKEAATKYTLQNANVTLYGSNDVFTRGITDYQNNISKLSLLETVKSDDKGEFKFKNVKIAQLKDVKYFYLYINYKNKALLPQFVKIQIDETASTNREVGNFNLLANTMRYSPSVFDKAGKITSKSFETVGLYRMKAVFEQEKTILENEGNVSSSRDEVMFNGSTYIKVAELKESNIVSLFGNSLFADQYILRLKEKDFDASIFPISTVNTSSITNTESFKITDVIQYTSPNPRVKGLVALGTESKNRPLASQQVSVFSITDAQLSNKTLSPSLLLMVSTWKSSVKSSDKGLYEIEIPATVGMNKAINKLGILVNNPNGGQPAFKLIDKPTKNLTENIYFTADGVSIAGSLKDQFGRAVVDAMVSYPNSTTVRTNAEGAFLIHLSDESDLKTEPRISVKAEGYKDSSFEVSQFQVLANTDLKDDGLAFVKTKVKDFSTSNFLNLEMTDEVFTNEFKNRNARVVKFYNQKNMLLESRDHLILIKTYTKKNDAKTFVKSSLKLNDNIVQIPENGLRQYVKSTRLNFAVQNEATATTLYLEDKLDDYTLPVSSQNGQAMTIELMLKEAFRAKGSVTAYNKDSVLIGALEGVEVSVKGSPSKATTGKSGEFELLIEKKSAGEELVFTKDSYNIEKLFVKVEESSKTIEMKLYQQDPSIPKFTHLQGMSVIIEKAINKGSNVFEITGKIDPKKLEGVFQMVEGQTLSFKNVPVLKDPADKTNAVLAREEMKFEETAVKLILHKYASVALVGKPAILLTKVTTPGKLNKGKIVGSFVKFTPERILGATPEAYMSQVKLALDLDVVEQKMGFNNDITAANQKKLDEAKPKEETPATEAKKEDKPIAVEKDSFFPVFISEGMELKNNEPNAQFKLVFPTVKLDSMNQVGVPEGFIPIGVLIGTLDINPKEAKLSKTGITFKGQFRLPSIAGAKFKEYFKLDRMVVSNTEDLSLKEASFLSPKGTFATIGVKGSWRFDVTKIQVFDNFKRYGIGGKMFTSQQNHLIVNSFTLNNVNGTYYPYMDMSFPVEGYKVKDVIFKSPKGQNIVFGYNKRDDVYQLDAGAILELKNSNNYPTLKNVFPLTVQKLMVNTGGAFMVSLKADVSIDVGPVKINIRRLLFSKGKTMEWRDMNDLLLRTEEETAKLTATKQFNNKNYQTVANKDSAASKNIGQTYQQTGKLKLDSDVELENDFVNWAFGFAGGVQIDKLKGAKCKSDASFLVGDFGQGVEVKFNSIDLLVETSTFKVFASVKLSTSGDKVGFEGNGEAETVKQKFGAGVKFYQLTNGIEFGASLVASTTIVMGSITWSSIGGAIDINTATNKYMVAFLGSAYPTGVSRDVTEFRNIKLSVLFSTNDCGALPVVEGTMDWYAKKELYCNIKAKLDFCRLLVLATMSCDKEVVKGAMAKVDATVFFTTKSFFLGATVRTTVFSMTVNGAVMIGGNTDLNATLTPKEVKICASSFDNKYLTNGSIVNGIYFKCRANAAASSNGNFWIASYAISYSSELDAIFVYNWTSNIFVLGVKADVKMNARATLLGFSIGGGVGVNLAAEGGYNSGWYFDASAGARLELYFGDAGTSCNSQRVKMCSQSVPCGLSCCCGRWWRPRLPRCSVNWCQLPYPCGLSAKLCLSGSVRLAYSQRNGMTTKF